MATRPRGRLGKEKSAREKAEADRRATLLKRVERRWTHRALASAWGAWTFRVNEPPASSVARRVANKLSRRVAVDAFDRWVERVAKKRLARRAAAKLANSRLLASLRRWRRVAAASAANRATSRRLEAEARRKASLVFRAAAKMAKRRLASAFASWTSAVRARLGRRAVARMGKRTMVHAFDRWRRTASASVAAEKTRADATARLIRQLFARRAAVKRFKMFAHWRRWASGSARSAKRLGDEMRAVLRSRFARRALDAWSDYAWEKATRRAEEKAARRFEGVGFAAEEKTKTEGEKGDSGRLFEKSSAAPRSPARSLEKSAALDPGASGGATPNPNPNQPASFSSSSLANIAFEGWSAAAMVKTTVFRDPNEPAGDAEDSDSAAPDPDPEAASAAADPERLASAAAAAALNASFESWSGEGADAAARATLEPVPEARARLAKKEDAPSEDSAEPKRATEWDWDATVAENLGTPELEPDRAESRAGFANPESPPYGTPRGDDDRGGWTAPSPIALPPLDGSRRGGGFGFDFGGGGVETVDFAFDDLGGERDAEYSAAHPRTTRGTRGVRASVLSDDPPPPRVSSSRGEEEETPRGEEPLPDASSSMLEQEVRVRARATTRDQRRGLRALISQLRRTRASPGRWTGRTARCSRSAPTRASVSAIDDSSVRRDDVRDRATRSAGRRRDRRGRGGAGVPARPSEVEQGRARWIETGPGGWGCWGGGKPSGTTATAD